MREARLSHEEIRELLAAVALGGASPEEAEAVRAHAAGCAECRRELESLGEAAGLVGLSAPAREVPDLGAVRARLVDRVAADRAGGMPRPGSRRPPRPARPASWWPLAAAAVLVIAAGAALVPALRDRDAARAEIAALRDSAAALRDSIAEQERLLGALTGPEVQVVNLAAAGERAPNGRMFWDQLAGRWTLVAHDLPALGAGRTYQLWVITTEGTRVSAGTFRPVGGSALVQATYELARDRLGAVAVTEEPEGGAPQPTGAIVIAGSPG